MYIYIYIYILTFYQNPRIPCGKLKEKLFNEYVLHNLQVYFSGTQVYILSLNLQVIKQFYIHLEEGFIMWGQGKEILCHTLMYGSSLTWNTKLPVGSMVFR